MANVAHASLTGAELHEPKGVESAALGTAYVADGNGSGNWTSVGTSSFTGMIADFAWPVVQTGWLECDGSDVNTTTYSALYDTMTIQMTGTRTNGSATITSLSSTANMRVGYYVFGTGIPSGTTISVINSGTQITLSTNATSSGTSQVVVSPWLLNTGTIRLPDLSAAGRFRRSRTPTTSVGQLQASQNLAHTHTGSGVTATENQNHTHNGSGQTGGQSNDHSHNVTSAVSNVLVGTTGTAAGVAAPVTTTSTTGVNTDHSHSFSFTTAAANQNHNHNFSFTTGSTGDTEARPVAIVLMTCVKY